MHFAPLDRIARHLPLTRFKILGARALYAVASRVSHGDVQVIERGGITFEVDIREGIDLSLFLFGSFQQHTFKSSWFRLAADAVVFDVGANCGVMSLNYARLVPRGRVYAFEPTDFALRKLRRNLELNPTLARRIEVTQTFVSHETSTSTDLTAYASWPVDGTHDAHAHPLHQGRAQATPNVGAITLDDFVTAHGIERLDFIKIDTDGHELDVLRGARAALARFRPSIVFEVGLYTMRERGQQFEDFLSLFESERYRLLDAASGAPIDRASFMLRIPERSTIDVLALPL